MFSQFTTALGVPSLIGQATGTSQLVGDTVFANPVAGAAIQIRNNGGTPVTVTPTPGGAQAQVAVLIIQRIA